MFLIVCLILVCFPESATAGAKEGLKVAFETVMPAIVPFAVLSSAVIFSRLGKVLGAFMSPVFCAMGLNGYGSVAFLSGMLGGYPTGAKAVCDMYEEGIIDKKEAEKMLGYTNLGGVIFAINILGLKAFGDVRAGVLVFLSQMIAALMTGKILGKSHTGRIDFKEALEEYKTKKPPRMAVLGKSIASGGSVMMNITSAFVVFYAVMEAVRLYKLPFIEGLCEMTRGVFYAGESGSIKLAALFFAFGGISVFAQTAAVCAKHDFSLKIFFIGKSLCAVFAFMIAYAVESVLKGRGDTALFTLLVGIAIVCALKLLKAVQKPTAEDVGPCRIR